jgi:hypothetical protein
MIRKIKSIGNLGVFNGFEWDKEVCNESGNVMDFQTINIIYAEIIRAKQLFRAFCAPWKQDNSPINLTIFI